MKNSTLKWLFSVTGKQNIKIVLLTLIQAVLGVSGVLFAVFMQNAIDYAVNKNKDGFFLYVFLMTSLIIAQLIFRAIIRFLEESCRSSIENTLKARLFNCLLTKDYAEVTATHSGEWINRLTSDTAIAGNGITEIIPNITGMAVKILSALVIMFTIEPKFAIVVIPGGLISIVLSYIFRKILKKMHKRVQESDGVLRIFLQERLSCLMMIRSFAVEDITNKQAVEKMYEYKSERMKKNRFSNLCNFGFGTAMNGLYILSFIYGSYGILNDTLSYGTLTAILQLVSQIQSPFANITGYLPKFYAMTASAERLMEAESYKDDCPNGTKKEIHNFYKENFKGITFENITFSYPSSKNINVIENVSININKGDYIAFKGLSGCGKSTLLKLLMSFYQIQSGNIYLIKKDGTKLPVTSQWRKLFAYVPQGNQLMNGSIREIVSFSKPEETDKIKKALEISCFSEIDINTVLGEHGSGLSEGQIQRIAIARAIFSDCPILLLDEATSALDKETEKKVLLNLKQMTDKTVIIVTHRPEALKICNKIFEITDKTIKEVTDNEKNRI